MGRTSRQEHSRDLPAQTAAAVWAHPTSARWYVARLSADLFEPLGLELGWGGRLKAGQRRAFVPAVDLEAARRELQRIHRRRLQHGYELIETL